jgi:hypothetical protein
MLHGRDKRGKVPQDTPLKEIPKRNGLLPKKRMDGQFS